MNDLAPDRKYTNAAIPVGGVDPHPDKPTGEFLTDVVSNDWVNGEYKLLVVRAAERALTAYAGQFYHLLCPSPDGAEVWMRRPMSIYKVDKAAGCLEFLYKCEGRGTQGMATLEARRYVQYCGPPWCRLHARSGMEEYRRARSRRRTGYAGALVSAGC